MTASYVFRSLCFHLVIFFNDICMTYICMTYTAYTYCLHLHIVTFTCSNVFMLSCFYVIFFFYQDHDLIIYIFPFACGHLHVWCFLLTINDWFVNQSVSQGPFCIILTYRVFHISIKTTYLSPLSS